MARRNPPHRLPLLAVLLLAAATTVADVPRHPLEERALVEPDAVLAALPGELARAEAKGAHRDMALLYLARANACRVVADWTCQRKAAIAARDAAVRADDVPLRIRATIAESRAAIALQDYSAGERLLGEAEALLRTSPEPELAADVYLAYSSLSVNIDKFALAVDYADRGLVALGPGVGDPLRARLLRNRARAQAQLGDLDEARQSLLAGLEVAKDVVDPKLAAELHLESARIARQAGLVAEQRTHGEATLRLAKSLRNSQIEGMGHEVLGLAALDAGARDDARRELGTALESFRALELSRDELRVARALLSLELSTRERVADVAPLARRVLELDENVLKSDRAQAADDFDSRLKYAQQELDVVRLEGEAGVQRERVRALQERERLIGLATLAGVAVLIVLAVSFVQQRRATRRLQSAFAALRASEARASELLRHSRGYVFLHGADGVLTMVNPAVAEALGGAPDELVGRRLGDWIVESDRIAFDSYLRRVEALGSDEATLRVRNADGTTRDWRCSSRRQGVGRRAYVIATAVDVTAQVRATEDLREQNLRDALTGAYNRRYADVFEAEHGSGRWGVVAMDLDHFKAINDTHGHERGDAVLVAFARFVGRLLRDRDAIVRFGGDEFVVLLPDADVPMVEGLVDRLRDAAPTAPCEFSIGRALREDGEALAGTLARADAAMYGARRVRRGADLGTAH